MSIKTEYKKYFSDKYFIYSLIFASVLLAVSLIVNFWTAGYATEKQSNAVTDIILSNTPIYNVADIFVFGLFALIIFIEALISAPTK